ncbi:unnamed protein product [Durusdinium trenchii]|uniref:Uncharacterized protein n=1 Tax=Durusdinium trenchii TaxID=1381693 RepID=A0ABP0HSZ2_9DINO
MRRAAIRRTVNPVNLDDVRASIEQQAACQVELCQALRALSGELRSRFGIFTAAASEEVLNELEKRACGLGVSDQEESPTPTTSGPAQSMQAPPRAPSPTLREVSASDGDEVPHVNDPLASAKFPMHAEVTAFQRQSERTEALRREVSTLRQMVDTSAANFKRVAEDSASFAMEKVEASLRLSQLEQLKEMKALLEQALDQREHLASLARDAMEQRLHHELQHVSEVMNANIQALQEAVAKNDQKTVEEAQLLGYRVDAVLDEVSKVDLTSKEREEAAMHVVNCTLADFRLGDLHSQAEACRELRGLTASIARGVLRLAEVCGVLSEHREDSDPLEAEYRIDDAWAVTSEGCCNTMALILQKAEQIHATRFAKEVGDFDARVYHECLHLVAAHQGFKEGLELSLPSRDQRIQHRKRPESCGRFLRPNTDRTNSNIGQAEKEAHGPSPFRGFTSALSTTCPTDQTARTPLIELRTATHLVQKPQSPRNLERPGSARLPASSRLSFQRPATSS